MSYQPLLNLLPDLDDNDKLNPDTLISADAVTPNHGGWLTKITDQDPDGVGAATAPNTQFGYNNRGDRTTVTDPLSRVTTTAYDDEQRPTSVTYPDPDGGGALTSPVESTTYNDVGWVLTTTNPRSGVTSYTYL